MLIGKDYDPNKNKTPKGEITEGSKSAKSSLRRCGRKDSEVSTKRNSWSIVVENCIFQGCVILEEKMGARSNSARQ